MFQYSHKAEQPTTHFLNPLKVLHCLEHVMDDNSIIVADGGDFVGSAAYILRYKYSDNPVLLQLSYNYEPNYFVILFPLMAY